MVKKIIVIIIIVLFTMIISVTCSLEDNWIDPKHNPKHDDPYKIFYGSWIEVGYFPPNAYELYIGAKEFRFYYNPGDGAGFGSLDFQLEKLEWSEKDGDMVEITGRLTSTPTRGTPNFDFINSTSLEPSEFKALLSLLDFEGPNFENTSKESGDEVKLVLIYIADTGRLVLRPLHSTRFFK